VVIGATTPLSGPAAAWGTTALGAEAWAKYVNEQGGVHGRKIRVELKDDGYNPGRSVANLNDMKDSVFAIVGLLGTAVLNANKDNIAEAKIPTIWPWAPRHGRPERQQGQHRRGQDPDHLALRQPPDLCQAAPGEAEVRVHGLSGLRGRGRVPGPAGRQA